MYFTSFQNEVFDEVVIQFGNSAESHLPATVLSEDAETAVNYFFELLARGSHFGKSAESLLLP